MMAFIKLEVFEADDNASNATKAEAIQMASDEDRLQIYEQGYTAGWEDAVKAYAEDQARIRVDLAKNIQSLSFTYQEALHHVLKSLRPMLEEIIGKTLPETANFSFGQRLAETLMPVLEKSAAAPVSLMIHPNARAAVEAVIENLDALPLQLIEETTLGEGQAYIRFEQTEIHLNMEDMQREIGAVLKNFYDLLERKDVNEQS